MSSWGLVTFDVLVVVLIRFVVVFALEIIVCSTLLLLLLLLFDSCYCCSFPVDVAVVCGARLVAFVVAVGSGTFDAATVSNAAFRVAIFRSLLLLIVQTTSVSCFVRFAVILEV